MKKFVTKVQKRSFCARDHIAALNIFKNELNGTEFSEDQLTEGLKSCGIPSNTVFRSELKKSPLLKVVAKDRLVFTTDKPIYYEWLDHIYHGYHRRVTQYNRTYKEKKQLQMAS